jgi:hypothetical protein
MVACKSSRDKTVLLACLVGLQGVALAQFETRTAVHGVPSSYSVAIGDFNGDGKLDLADAANNLQVFLGNGDGTFQPPANYLVGTGALFVATADLNGDGKLDLAVADESGLYVLMGNGDGTFQTPVLYTTACIPIFVTAGDFNGGKATDLLVTYGSGNCGYVSVFLGNGDGTFQQTPVNTAPSYDPAAVGVGDFNHDGRLDIAVAEQFGTTSQVEIMLGNGNGTFSAGQTYAVGSFPTSVAVADFRSDGKLDLAVATLYGVTNVLLGNGDGTFQANGTIPTPDADWVLSADFNNDGKPDLAVATQGIVGVPSGINVATGNGDGTFQAPEFFPAGTDDRFVAAGDFNGDHKTDLVVPDARFGDIVVLLNTGVASFTPTTPIKYASQLINTTSPPQTVTLTNTGASTLSISSFRISGSFQQTNTCGNGIAPGAACSIQATFAPQSPGGASGMISISDGASIKPQVIDLAGEGTVVSLSPMKLTFPPQKVGTTSPPRRVKLTNHGSMALSITVIGVDGNDFRDFPETSNCPSSLGASGSCTVTVTFSPAKTGEREATLEAVDNGGGSPQIVRLSGTGN